jgi:hypothetical protein
MPKNYVIYRPDGEPAAVVAALDAEQALKRGGNPHCTVRLLQALPSQFRACPKCGSTNTWANTRTIPDRNCRGCEAKYSLARRRDVPTVPQTDDRPAAVRQLYTEGFTVGQIAKALQLSRQRVTKIIASGC